MNEHEKTNDPRHKFLVEFHAGDDEDVHIIEVEAYDAVAAIAAVASSLSDLASKPPIPISKGSLSAATADAEKLDPVCSGCGHQGPSVRPLSEEFGLGAHCPACMQKLINEMIEEGKLESRVGEDGQIYYRGIGDWDSD